MLMELNNINFYNVYKGRRYNTVILQENAFFMNQDAC